MGLVAQTDEGVQVRHALIADAVLETLSPTHVRELHRAVARRVDDPGEAARHWAAAGERGKARALALQAAATAERPTERARCAALAATCLDGPERDRELVAAMSRLAALSDFPAVVDLSHQITPGSRDEPEALRLRARGLFETHRPDDAAAAVAAGLATADRFGDEAAAVRLRITAAYHLLWSGNPATLRPDELIADALALGVADAEMHVQAAAAIATAATVTPLAVELAHRGRELALEEDHAWAEQESWAAEATALNNLGRWEEAMEATRLGEADLLRRGYHTTVARVRASRADHMAWNCEYDTALDLTEELLSRPSLLGGSWDTVVWSRALALSDTGDISGADALLDEMEGNVLLDGAYWLTLVRADALLARGQGWKAARVASAALDRVHIDAMRPQVLALVARAQWECDIPIAREASEYDALFTLEHYAEIEGLAALQAGDPCHAVERFRFALTVGGSRRHLLRYRLGLAEALELCDPVQATVEFDALVAELRTVGWVTLLERVEPLLSAPAGTRRLRVRQADAPPTISQREHDVLTLVADGLTSRAIAERLSLSQSTVESHIRSAMRKLDARTRAEAAAIIRAPHEPT
ncbi:helix-turn-helix transcriptional regulator [Svornostia abyssi]|uniref:Helix-turn-helix transcriptional regulator n=1 Tax=Svornostia abyssi TaxID=2898438 RepID=A0ABY5PMS9_9ACTN|nr:helix-turn-helix transcriptional regulator [Parviterribacteraceae bacterium J379]